MKTVIKRKLKRSKRAVFFRRLRKRPEIKIKERLNRKLRHVLKGENSPSLIPYLGISEKLFIDYIASLLHDGMTLENHGKIWHLDHKIPCSKFDLNDESQVKACWNYLNLQPLPIDINRKKSNKIL